MIQPKRLTDEEMVFIRKLDEWGYEPDDDGNPTGLAETHVNDLLCHIAVLEAEPNTLLSTLQEIVKRIPDDVQLPGTPLLTDCLANLLDQYISKSEQFKRLEADMASLIQAGNEMRKNLGRWTWETNSPLYRWDEVVKQTTAIGAATLLRDSEEARTLRTKVNRLEADLTFGVFPGWRTYEEWVAAGRPFDPRNDDLAKEQT